MWGRNLEGCNSAVLRVNGGSLPGVCGYGRVVVEVPLRTVQRLVDGTWTPIAWEDIRKGDRVRIAESDGVPVTEAVADTDYDPTLGTGGFRGTPIPEVPSGG